MARCPAAHKATTGAGVWDSPVLGSRRTSSPPAKRRFLRFANVLLLKTERDPQASLGYPDLFRSNLVKVALPSCSVQKPEIAATNSNNAILRTEHNGAGPCSFFRLCLRRCFSAIRPWRLSVGRSSRVSLGRRSSVRTALIPANPSFLPRGSGPEKRRLCRALAREREPVSFEDFAGATTTTPARTCGV